MPTIAELLVTIAADSSKLTVALTNAKGQLASFASSTDISVAGLTRFAIAADTAGAAVLGFFALATRAAGELQKEQMLLAQAAESSGRAFDLTKLNDLAEHYSKLTGVTRAQILEAQRNIITFGATQDQVEKLTPRMLDMAVKTGSLANAATLVGRALTGQDMALRRVLGQLGDGINLTTGFDAAMTLLDQRMGGLATTFAQTLPGSINRFKVAVNEFLIGAGTPLIGDATSLVSTAAALLSVLAGLEQAMPGVTHAFETFAVVMGVLMIGAGSVAGFVAVMRFVAPVLAIAQAGVDALIAPMIGLTAATDGAIVAFIGLNTVMQASIIGAIITGLILLAENWQKVVRATIAAAAWVLIYANNVAHGNLSMRDAARSAGQYADGIMGVDERTQKATRSSKELEATLGLLKAQYELLTQKTALVELSSQIEASKQAISALQHATTQADLKAIEEGRLRANELAAQVKLQADFVNLQNRILQEKAAGADTTTLEKDLAGIGEKLLASRLKTAQETAAGVVDATRAEIEERSKLQTEEARLESDLIVARADEQRSVGDEETRILEQQIDARMSLLTLEENTRVAMLRRTAEIEQQQLEAAIMIRENLLRAQEEEFTAFSIAQAERRRQAIEAGNMTADDARKLTELEAEAHEQAMLQRQIEVEQAKVEAIEKTYQVQRALAEEEERSQLALLAAETDARKKKLLLDEKMREDDLYLSEVTARAETEAKLAELKAQHDMELFNLNATIAARQAAGVMSPEEAMQRQALLSDLDKGFIEAEKGLVDSLQIKYDTVHQQILMSRRNLNDQLLLTDQESAVKAAGIQQGLASTIAGLQNKRAESTAKAAEELAGLEAQVAKWVETESAKLRAEGWTPDAIINRLRPIIDLQNSLHQMAGNAGAPSGEAGPMTIAPYSSPFPGAIWDPVARIWKTASDIAAGARSAIADATTTAPATVGGAGASVSGVMVSGNGNLLFSFNGVQLHLTADETAVLHRVIAALLGPEGNRQVEQWIKSQPGGTRVTAGGS